MKIQSWIAAGVLAVAGSGAIAQGQPAARKAPPPGAEAQQQMIKRAKALTEEQIKQSHDVAALTRLAQLYNASADLQRFTWVLRQLTEVMPNSGDLKLQLAMAYATANDKRSAYDVLVRMQTQGFGYDIANDTRFEPIHGTKVWDYIVTNLQANAKQFCEGKTAFELPKGDNLFDALAWDAKRGQLLVGSARDGKVYIADSAGKLADFIAAGADNGLWGVDALGVDGAHGKLYVASSASVIYKGFNADNAGSAGIFEFDLATGKLLHKYTFVQSDGAHRLTSLVVGKDGQVYAADGARKQVFKIEAGGLKTIAQNPKLTRISGLALSADGRTLYLADFALGIYGFDLAKAEPFEMRYSSANLVLGGIVGMYWYDGTLVVIENGMLPKRVMRLTLTADGRGIDAAMPLDVAQPAFTDLGSGAVAGEKLYFFANREDTLYDERGVLTAADKLEPQNVFSSNLRFAWGQKGVSAGLAPIGAAKKSDLPKKPGQTAPGGSP